MTKLAVIIGLVLSTSASLAATDDATIRRAVPPAVRTNLVQFQQFDPSVVWPLSGVGVLVSPRHVLTAWHCVSSADRMAAVDDEGGFARVLGVAGVDHTLDIAVVKLDRDMNFTLCNFVGQERCGPGMILNTWRLDNGLRFNRDHRVNTLDTTYGVVGELSATVERGWSGAPSYTTDCLLAGIVIGIRRDITMIVMGPSLQSLATAALSRADAELTPLERNADSERLFHDEVAGNAMSVPQLVTVLKSTRDRFAATRLASLCKSAERQQQGLDGLRAAVDAQPQWGFVRVLYASALWQAGRKAESHVMFGLLDDTPFAAMAKSTQATLALAAGDYLDAEKYAKQCTELHPAVREGWHTLARVAVKTNRTALYKEALDGMLAAYPSDPPSWLNLAVIGAASNDAACRDRALATLKQLNPLTHGRATFLVEEHMRLHGTHLQEPLSAP